MSHKELNQRYLRENSRGNPETNYFTDVVTGELKASLRAFDDVVTGGPEASLRAFDDVVRWFF